ncbi:hypothetical protein G9C98_003941 [Cotesia typhae]|uniref:Uncharacterized protein n=1 Tax=Cotesia typhae TaxID=2053667 RepID=A0A8J5V7A9_9HYME|nr:hypothetical protein G9C98_003941 [Cotesia typhae]
MDEFIMINRLQSYIKSFDEESPGDLTDLYRCDPPNYDNSIEAKYYELTRMIQVSIVKEEDLDIHKSCRHNCDTETIQNSMNLTMCQGYQRCQYVGKSFEICEMNKIIATTIVVGVRFMKKNNMIHVQIKEAKLKPLGLTEQSEWKELENFHYNETIGSFFVKNDNGTQTFLKENVDYGFPDQIRLEDVRAPSGFVITGVAFQFFQVTSYDYELDLRYPDLSTKSSKNNIYWTDGDFVKFQTSDLIKDAGQSTVPFFDAQDVDGDPEFPLGGIGVLHRGHDGYSGFLIFRIFKTRLSNVFKSDLYDSYPSSNVFVDK